MSLLAWLLILPAAASVLVCLGACRAAGRADDWIEAAVEALEQNATPRGPHVLARESVARQVSGTR